MSMKPYGIVGTNEVIMAEEWNQPGNTVMMATIDSPGPGYVIDETGNWVYPGDLDKVILDIKDARKLAYLAAWPIDKQMEAIGDHLDGDPTKFNQMQLDFKEIRDKYQYPSQDDLKPKKSLGVIIKKATD